MTKWDLFLEYKDGSTYGNQSIYYVTKSETRLSTYTSTSHKQNEGEKNQYMIVSIHEEKAFDKIQPTFNIKILNKLGI